MKKSYNSICEVLSLPRFSDVKISPNGKNLSYVKRTTNWEENSYKNNVWIYENGKNYPILNGKSDTKHPSWSPDGSTLAYLGDIPCTDKDKNKNQIFLKTYDKNNGIQLTNCEDEIKFFKWSPDGKGIYYVAPAADTEEMKERKKLYGDFKIIDSDYKNNALYYIEIEKVINKESLKVKSEECADLSIQVINSKDLSVAGFDVSQDLKNILLVTTPSSEMKDFEDTDLYILSLDSMKLRKLKFDGIIADYVSFSPDNKGIAFSKTPNGKVYYKNSVSEDTILEAYDLLSGKKIFDSSNLDRSVELIKWTDKGLLGLWQDKTSYKVGMFSINGEIKLFNGDENCYIESVDITSDGENIAYIKADEKNTFEVYLNNKQITNLGKLYEEKLQSKKKLVKWEVSDGSIIEGVLSLPEEFDETKKYPLLIIIHGGPTWASFMIHDSGRLYPIEEFIEKGYIVLEPNYRGSSGYGNKFRISNYRNLGIGDYEDVISGVDMLIEKGYVDGDRVGVMGWSQGGYISAMCSTYSNRFKAISVGAGVSNWMTYYVNTDITPFTLSYLGANPWNDPKIYAITSPMTYIKGATTPTLIQHGEKDARVPLPNAFELYRGLRDVGVEARLITYDGMGHSPNKPRIMKAIMEQNLDWFVRHIPLK